MQKNVTAATLFVHFLLRFLLTATMILDTKKKKKNMFIVHRRQTIMTDVLILWLTGSFSSNWCERLATATDT